MDHPIQNSEVYLLGVHAQSLAPHPPPPSPPTPCETHAMSPVPDNVMPITPPNLPDPSPGYAKRLAAAVHVLGTEATALSHLTRLYETDPVAKEGFNQAVEAITNCMGHRGKIVICGVGKSGHIAKKLVATMNSLRIAATFLHPTEALHGDLGKVGDYDVILLITFSGRTPELLQLLPHFSPSLPLLIITSHTHPSTCALVDQRPDAILLPAPIHESESSSFGVSAPTTSTTVALALGDALAVAISDELHPSVAEVFSRYHPGGAIGQAAKAPRKVADLAITLSDIPDVCEGLDALPQAVHVIMAGYQSPTGWVRYGNKGVAPPAKIRCLEPEDMNILATGVTGLVVSKKDWIPLPADMSLKEAADRIKSARGSVHMGATVYDDEAIIGTMMNGEIIGVLEVATLLSIE
jgi:D-arabinose 5-phosphate isomerase GutQ